MIISTIRPSYWTRRAHRVASLSDRMIFRELLRRCLVLSSQRIAVFFQLWPGRAGQYVRVIPGSSIGSGPTLMLTPAFIPPS